MSEKNFQTYFLFKIFRTGNEIEKAIVSFEFLVDIHADDSEFTLLGQAGPAARQILLRANHQIFLSLSPYSGHGSETLCHCVTIIQTVETAARGHLKCDLVANETTDSVRLLKVISGFGADFQRTLYESEPNIMN